MLQNEFAFATACQAVGRTQEDFLVSSQNKRRDAHHAAVAAAYQAFEADLEADQVLFDAAQVRLMRESDSKRKELLAKMEAMQLESI